jgi:asparagine synthase (glutamine-hydrolysing)
MCGICGIFGKSDIALLNKMLPTIAHRGIDDEYYLSLDDCCIGARRLSIIDLQGGRQPVTNEDGSIILAQNGEIYNYPELRESLIKSGHKFKSNCDTEVIVHAYEEYGYEFINKLNGMFAISLWDDRNKSGLLVRDRTGEKPLYYFKYKDCLYFASEIKALLQLPFYERRLNYEALHHFLSYKHVPSPLTIFKDIYMLSPAYYIIYKDGQITLKKYWDLPASTYHMDETEIVEELIRLLRQGVKIRLISDVPIGISLSGGLDSSLITALASEVSTNIETFTLTYPKGVSSIGKKTDQDNARIISKMYGTHHHEEPIEFNGFADTFPKVISCFDQPYAGAISTYYLSKQMRRYVKVALTGDGSDEQFGSYLSHRLARPLYNYKKYKETGLDKYNNFIPYQSDKQYLESLVENNDWDWRSKLFVLSEEEKRSLYSTELHDIMSQFNTTEHIRTYFNGYPENDPLNRILKAEFCGIFPDQVLEFSDKLSMAYSLELRASYLDYEFVEFVAKIQGNLKINNGITKYILKKTAGKYLPKDIIYRSKEGFIPPITEWFYWDLRDYVQETLNKDNLSKHGLFNIDYVKQLIDEFYNRSYDYRRGNKLLSLIAFQVWYNIYMDGCIAI